jgi:hypothetical protein
MYRILLLCSKDCLVDICKPLHSGFSEDESLDAEICRIVTHGARFLVVLCAFFVAIIICKNKLRRVKYKICALEY